MLGVHDRGDRRSHREREERSAQTRSAAEQFAARWMQGGRDDRCGCEDQPSQQGFDPVAEESSHGQREQADEGLLKPRNVTLRRP